MGDFLYNAPTDMALKMHSRFGATSHLYVMTYVGSKSFGDLQRDRAPGIVRSSYGVTHMDDLFYVMANEYNPQELDAQEKQASTQLIQCLSQFIDPARFYGRCNMKLYTYDSPNYIAIGANGQLVPVATFRNQEDMSFWSNLISIVIEFTATPPPYFPYREYNSFQAATWSMLAFILILVIVVIGLAAVLCMNKRNEKRSLTLLRARDRELEERYIDE